LRAALEQKPADTMADPALEAMRTRIPAARALPLLGRLAQRASGHRNGPERVVLDYLGSVRVRLEIDA